MVRPHELECSHGIGHQLGSHGCDGCCGRIFGGLVEQEQERIIKLWDQEMKCECEDPMRHLLTLIKGENKFYETSCVCCNGEHWG